MAVWRAGGIVSGRLPFPLLDVFRQYGWEPPAPELKSLFRQILADSQGQTVESPSEACAISCVLERWLAEGRQGELPQSTETDLVKKLKEAIPPDGVKIVSGLATKPNLAPATIESVAKSDHWLVRMAGVVTGITQEVLRDIGPDSNYWINEMVGVASVLDLWPTKATPANLEKLRSAPAEAFTGKLGAARKVLLVVLHYRVLEA